MLRIPRGYDVIAMLEENGLNQIAHRFLIFDKQDGLRATLGQRVATAPPRFFDGPSTRGK